jgi:hypothetical protein
MSLIVFKVAKSMNRWAVLHNEQPLATFDTQAEAERTALALATHHPKRDTAELDLPSPTGQTGEIRVF